MNEAPPESSNEITNNERTYQNESLGEWIDEWVNMNEWIKSASQWVWMNEWASEWGSEWMSQPINEPTTEPMSESMNERTN